MREYLQDLHTHKEWEAMCKRFKRFESVPPRHISTVKSIEVLNRRIWFYSRNKIETERDIGLVTFEAKGTPNDKDFWVCGISSLP